MMVVGLLTVWGWDSSPWASAVFKLLPGMVVPLAMYALVEVFDRLNSPTRRT